MTRAQIINRLKDRLERNTRAMMSIGDDGISKRHLLLENHSILKRINFVLSLDGTGLIR